MEADQLLQTEVVPAVLSCTSVEDENNTLLSMTYNILCNWFGSKPLPKTRKRHQHNRKQFNRRLRVVTELKNAARQEWRKAKKDGASNIHEYAGTFLGLLREHSQLKRASVARSEARSAKNARE